MSENVQLAFIIFLGLVFFTGEPSLLDAIIHAFMECK